MSETVTGSLKGEGDVGALQLEVIKFGHKSNLGVIGEGNLHEHKI